MLDDPEGPRDGDKKDAPVKQGGDQPIPGAGLLNNGNRNNNGNINGNSNHNGNGHHNGNGNGQSPGNNDVCAAF